MKRSIPLLLLSLIATPVLADGHNLDGLIFYYLGIVVLVFFLPLLLLTIFSARYYYKPGKVRLGISLTLLSIVMVTDIYLFIINSEYASYRNAGQLYFFCLLSFILTIGLSIGFLLSGKRKVQTREDRVPVDVGRETNEGA
jgi:hypothetical protein